MSGLDDHHQSIMIDTARLGENLFESNISFEFDRNLDRILYSI